MAGAALAAAMLLASAGCARVEANGPVAAAATVAVTIRTAARAHVFAAELADSPEEQARGMMYRGALPANGAMLFAPYPPGGGPPIEAAFWMKNVGVPLDILFIRADGTIARIAENAPPSSEVPIVSGEPVSAVLELNGGRARALGIGAGDKVSWPGQGTRNR